MHIPAVVAQMERLGLRFGEPCRFAQDHLHAELPPGWKIRLSTDTGIFSVQDARRRDRVHMVPFSFGLDTTPNAAKIMTVRLCPFYERWAMTKPAPEGGTVFMLQLRTANNHVVLQRTWNFPYPEHSVMYHILEDRIYRQFKAWLLDLFPGCDDPFAYWDE